MTHSQKLLAALIAAAVTAPGVALAGKPNAEPGAEAWYLKTVVTIEDGEDVFFDDRSGVFGRLPGAQEGRDPHDAPVWASVASSPAAVVFLRDEADWGEDAGEYLSDYRPAGDDKQTWTFTVVSSRPDAVATLTWDTFFVITEANGSWLTTPDNDNPTVAELSLIDLETGDKIPAASRSGQMKSYSFNMNGASERHFRWVQGKVSKDDRSLASAATLQSLNTSRAADVQAGAVAAPAAAKRGLAESPPAIDRD